MSPFVFRTTLASLAVAAFLAACDSGSSNPSDNVTPDAATTDTGAPTPGTDAGNEVDAAPGSDCVSDPKTAYDILNACTDAQAIDKNPVLPGLLPDGGLPPLP